MTDSEMIFVSDLGIAWSIHNAERRLGCTLEDLREWAQTGDYPTVRHKGAWYTLGPYYDNRDHYRSLLDESSTE